MLEKGKKRCADDDVPTSSGKSKKMLETNRLADDIAKFSRARFGRQVTLESLIPVLERDASQGKLSGKVADSSKSVVSIALSSGHELLFSSSGIAIESQGNVARFLTSSSLVRALEDATKGHNNVKIEVRHGGNVVIGILDEYDLHLEFAIVMAVSFPNVRGILIDHDREMKFVPGSKVVAVGRHASGKLMTTVGRPYDHLFSPGGGEYIVLSARRFSEDWNGGALFDCNGKLLGMNLTPATGTATGPGPYFILRSIVRRRWVYLPPKVVRAVRLLRDKKRSTDIPWDRILGYPEPSQDMISRGMVLVDTFEDPFGDEYPKGVWNEFRKSVSANISQNVVALASFNGEKRFFACSGFFIESDNDCSTILTSANLIEVLLPHGRHVEGSLQHCSFHYNVATVTVKNLRAVRPMRLECEGSYRDHLSLKLVAVGRCYRSGTLMAIDGRQVRGDTHGHGEIFQSTCTIAKAGIGGPVLNVDGNIVGMIFFGGVLLDHNRLCAVLHYFKTKSTKYQSSYGNWAWIKDDKGADKKHRWMVPEAEWCDPLDLVEDELKMKWIRGLKT